METLTLDPERCTFQSLWQGPPLARDDAVLGLDSPPPVSGPAPPDQDRPWESHCQGLGRS